MFLVFPIFIILKKIPLDISWKFFSKKQFSVLRKLTLYIEDNLQNVKLYECYKSNAIYAPLLITD